MRKTKISLAVAALIGSSLAMSGAVAESGGYRVTDIGAVEGAIHTSPRAINNSGHVVGQLADLQGQNLRLDLLDPENFESIEDLNNPTERERRQLRNYLLTSVGVNPKFQNLAIELGYYFDTSSIYELDGFEALDNETGQRTDSVSFRVLGMNNNGITVGQSATPYQWVEDFDREGELDRFHLRDTFPQGAWSDGLNYRLVTGEPGLLMNGTAALMAINDTNVAVGFAGVANGANLTAYYENECTSEDEVDEDGEPIFLEPEEACLHRYWFERSGIAGQASPLMDEEAYRWVFDNQGNVIEQGSLGIAFDKEADEEDAFDTLRYRSVANDINNHGIAVGVSQRQVAGGSFTRPTLFNEDGALRLLDGETARNNSLAIAINDNNIMVGYSNISINNAFRQRLFFMDVTNGPAEATYPNGFFDDSSWQPRAINNQGQVVGYGQNDAVQNAQRRSTGFLYDINTDSIVDLNVYLSCDSQYTILDAIDINDAGEIAVVAVEIADIEEDGELSENAILRTLVLTPDSSAEVGCPDNDETQLERKGAANHPLWLGILALFAVISLRRRKIIV